MQIATAIRADARTERELTWRVVRRDLFSDEHGFLGTNEIMKVIIARGLGLEED